MHACGPGQCQGPKPGQVPGRKMTEVSIKKQNDSLKVSHLNAK